MRILKLVIDMFDNNKIIILNTVWKYYHYFSWDKNIFSTNNDKNVFIAGCKTKAGMGYSLWPWVPKRDILRAQWISAVKCKWSDWDSPTDTFASLLKVLPAQILNDGLYYCDDMVLLMRKKLRPDTIPTVFPKPEYGIIYQSSTLTPRPVAEKRWHLEVIAICIQNGIYW